MMMMMMIMKINPVGSVTEKRMGIEAIYPCVIHLCLCIKMQWLMKKLLKTQGEGRMYNARVSLRVRDRGQYSSFIHLMYKLFNAVYTCCNKKLNVD